MTSEIRANTLKNRVGLGTIEYSNTGPVISGVTTSNNFKTGSTNVHSVGVEAAGINVLGADTPIGTGSTIYNSGAAVFTGIVTANNLSVTNDIDAGDDLTIGGELNMVGSSDSNKYFDVRTGASNALHIRSSLGGASNLVTMLSIGRNGSSFVGNLTLGDSSDSSSAAGPEFKLNRNSASPANADYLGQIKFAGRSSTGIERNYAKITGKILDVTNGSEDGILEFAHIKNGSQNISARFRSDSLQLLNGTSLTVAGTSTFTGDVDISDTIVHTGDTNTKIRFPANDTISFETAGSERIRIDSNGYVGIKESSPHLYYSPDLVVKAGADAGGITIRSAGATHNNYLMFADGNSGDTRYDGYIKYSHNNRNLQFATAAAVRFTIDSVGRVGVNQSSFATSDTMFSVTETTGHCEIGIISKNDSAVVINLGDTDSYNQGRIKYDNSDNSLTFRTVGTDRLRITSGGHVNIGGNYTQTSKTLYVDGTIEATSNLTCVNQIYLSGTAPQLVFTDTNQDSDYTIKNDGGQLAFIDRTNSNAVRMYANTGGFGGDRLYIANDIVHTGDTDTSISFFTDTILLNTAGTQRFRVYDDGYVIIGDTSKSSTAGAGGLDIQGNSTNCVLEMGNPFPGVSGGVNPAFRITATNSNKNVDFESVWGGTNQLYKHLTFAGGNTMFYNGTSNTEVVRITGSGLTVGTTSLSDAHNTDEGVVLNENGQVMCRRNSTMFTAKSIQTGGYTAFRVLSAQTQVGSISFNSGGTSFNTSSDYRRKENVIDLTDAITRLKTLKPKRFNFISNPSVTLDGFLAHEVTAVPEAITGTKDEVATEDGEGYAKGDPIYQQLDQSKLVPLLTAALQEAISEIETLKTKVAALEG